MKTTLAITGLVFLSFTLSIYFSPQIPERMATQWNSQGEVNGYISKLLRPFFTPVVILGIAILFLAIPGIDPKIRRI